MTNGKKSILERVDGGEIIRAGNRNKVKKKIKFIS